MTDNCAMDDDSRKAAQAAEAARRACIAAALAAYEDAGVLGLCAEGRWEAAISAMQSLDLRSAAASPEEPSGPAD
jgi:hypothetical protein